MLFLFALIFCVCFLLYEGLMILLSGAASKLACVVHHLGEGLRFCGLDAGI